MRQLHPEAVADVDPLDRYLADERPSPDGRPWVMVNMVASTDGAVAVDGLSGGLGGEPDRLVFRAVRACCDWVLVAAGTARAERYGRPRRSPEVAARRAALGMAPTPRLAVVTGSFDLDPGLPMFAEPDGDAPLVLTGEHPPADAVAALDGVAEVVRLPGVRPTPDAVLAELGRRGAQVVLAEGGPTFNGQLVDADVVDELCLSLAPVLVGGGSSRIVAGAGDRVPADLDLTRLLEADGVLFARYVRR